MQIKTTMRYRLTPVRMSIINKSTNSKCWQGCGERENPCALLLEMQTDAATVENNMGVPQKTENGTALLPSDSTFGNLSEET